MKLRVFVTGGGGAYRDGGRPAVRLSTCAHAGRSVVLVVPVELRHLPALRRLRKPEGAAAPRLREGVCKVWVIGGC